MTLSEELQWRGFINQTTLPDVKLLDKPGIRFYFGVDPSADSMQVGNLATLLMTLHFKNYGHMPYLLVGGATGMIGDPAGKDEERQLLAPDQVIANKQKIADQFKRVMNDPEVEIVDNYDWFKEIRYLDFLRDVGKHFSMTPLLQRDYIANRIGPDGSGMSYAEFSYTLIQGYDFLHLFREKGVTLQVCGSDQWGNSISGVELIRRVEGAEAHIWSAPLVINKSTGKKFGKSEGGAIWLDSNKTSVYRFYQFWLNADDSGVEEYLKIFTLLSKEGVDSVMAEFKQNPAARAAQKTLAYEVTKIVHGQNEADTVKRVTEVLFGGETYNDLVDGDYEILKQELPFIQTQPGVQLIDVLVETQLAGSKNEARRILTERGIYINGLQTGPDKTSLELADTLNGFVILRRGKNNHALVKFHN